MKLLLYALPVALLVVYSQFVVKWRLQFVSAVRLIKTRMSAEITDALTMVWFYKRPQPGLLNHSDRGSQYGSHAFRALFKEHDMICSMGRKGNCWDNTSTESWFNSFKNEPVCGVSYDTHAQVKPATFIYTSRFSTTVNKFIRFPHIVRLLSF